jgi:cytochrome c oxidase subunit III
MSKLTKRGEPYQFMLWLGILGSVLLFLFLMMAYTVRKSSTDWADVALPRVFWLSTVVMLLSSLTLHWANKAFRNESFPKYRWLMGTTLTLGLAFVVMQALGWHSMFTAGISLQNSPAGAFVYILSGLHLLHIVGGLFFLIVVFTEALKRTPYIESFVYSVNPPNQLKITLVTLYWHFVDVLWLILFVFLLYHHTK